MPVKSYQEVIELQPGVVAIMGLFSYREWKEYEHRWKKRLEALPPYYTQSYRISATFTHTLSPYTFYNFALSHYNLFYQILGKHMHEYNPVCELNDDGYVIKGDKAYWEDNIQNISLIKADITSKRGTHQMKGGGEFIYYDLYMNSAYQVQMRTADPKFPIYLTYYTKYKYYPKSAAMYLQDKFRYEFFVIDLGLRFDYFDPCAQRPKIIEPTFGSWIIDLSDTVRASPKSQLSPRIGITFFSSNFSIRFNYGLFFQMPLFEYLYRNVNYDFSSGYPPVLGDPDLQAAKTEAMEAGVKRFLSKSTVVTATAFSKIASNLVDCITHYDPTEGTMDRVPVAGYNKYVSVEQANIKGIELDLQKIYGRLLTGRISYTYQTATAIFKMSEFAPELRHPLSWDQRHKLVLNLDLRQQDTWGVNILWEWNSPLPYTSRPEMPNMDRMWPRYRLDLKVEKIFYPMNKRLSVYLEVKNLLDKKMSCG
ncbi:MAG TPA: TonB-dependent receptor [bacterium (Candidatus Stahlbacteria)]|nr:TonB-dependent receptor [Candidatus Stahlbacteria bacterium]